jgi:hypothetical protein
MSTAGNLVFQGRGNGEFWVYAADSGKVLKSIQTGSHIVAAPMTYAVDGVQYAVQVGYGGTAMGVGPIPPMSASLNYENVNRIIAFKLDGGEVPKPMARKDEPFPEATRKRGEPRRDPGWGDQIYRAMLALPYARPEHYSRSTEDAAGGPREVQQYPARRRLCPDGHGKLRGHPE